MIMKTMQTLKAQSVAGCGVLEGVLVGALCADPCVPVTTRSHSRGSYTRVL